MVENQGEDLDHLPIAAGRAQQMPLQPLEGVGQIKERRPVAQGVGLALDDRQVMSPVINGVAGAIMRAVDDALVLAHDLPLGDNQEAVGVDPEADRAVGKGGGHAVAVALEMNEAGR